MKRLLLRYAVFGVLILFLAVGVVGCGSQKKVSETLEDPIFSSTEEIASLRNMGPLVAVRNGSTLELYDPASTQGVMVYEFGDGELPLTSEFGEMVVSPNNRFVVWYTPQKGVLAYDLEQRVLNVVESSSEWLSAHPYFEFGGEEAMLYFVTDGGEQLNQVDLMNGSHEHIAIPYPFGFEFRVAPDMKRVVYVTGFGIDPDRPKFMFTELGAVNAERFSEDTELVDRHSVVWAPDSSGILTIKDGDMYIFEFDDPRRPRLEYAAPGGRFVDIQSRDGLIYIKDDVGYWQVYDFVNHTRVAQTPSEIFAEMRRPRIYPWYGKQFLISERINDENETYQRLWRSNFRGIKEVVIPEYDQTTVDRESVQLD